MIADTGINRFIRAQENIYPQVVNELQNGKKTSHWMWFIFPQIEGLGFSSTSKYYSIKTIAEAKEYVMHPVLGKRLLECSTILLNIEGKSAESIFGYPDNLKLQSSMTLFSFTSPESTVFLNVLNKYFNNKKDQKTLDILKLMGAIL
ncbi:MAG TPA: DUF1810 domain-containing protein [Ginsengibacter sp.]|jgi:uncharacterized protein (DUF1810 family)